MGRDPQDPRWPRTNHSNRDVVILVAGFLALCLLSVLFPGTGAH